MKICIRLIFYTGSIRIILKTTGILVSYFPRLIWQKMSRNHLYEFYIFKNSGNCLSKIELIVLFFNNKQKVIIIECFVIYLKIFKKKKCLITSL